MGKFKKGILGPFNGTVGTVVGSSWKNVDYMRSRPKPFKSSTPGQVAQRARFALVTKFLNAVSDFIGKGYQDANGSMTGRNNALSQILKNAVTGDYPHSEISYNFVAVSKGSLSGVANPHATAAAAKKIHFGWTDNTGIGNAKATDKTMLLVYCPVLHSAVFTLAGPDRSAQAADLDTPAFSGQIVETWLAFCSADGSATSPSIFTGELTAL